MVMRIWMLGLLAVLLVSPACRQEEPPEEKATVQKEDPSSGEKSTVDKEPPDKTSLTPQEGEEKGKQPLEVVDRNISEATDMPSVTGKGDEGKALGPEINGGPETVTFEAKNGNVTFHHKMHAEREGCTACHTTDPPEKLVLDRESAHELCRGCHKERGAGPANCNECHKSKS